MFTQTYFKIICEEMVRKLQPHVLQNDNIKNVKIVIQNLKNIFILEELLNHASEPKIENPNR
jgi:uncharacterized protein YabN with tetrapyrrole methylase and pyrophosphatase domain